VVGKLGILAVTSQRFVRQDPSSECRSLDGHAILLPLPLTQTPLRDLADSLGMQVPEIGEPHFDDPSLALLFSQLRSKTLQTAAGTSEISGRREFNFVLQVARVFCRMGKCCSLDLRWSMA
jgi:hypothetical protein